MELDFVLITIILSLISLLGNLWVTYVYIKNKDLQVHPSDILACISIFEIIMSNHSIALALDTNLSIHGYGPHHMIELLSLFRLSFEDSKNISCAINQMLFAGSVAGVLSYNMFLCLDLIITLRNPLIPGKQRMKFYHVLAFFTITLEMGYNLYENMKYEVCKMDTNAYIYQVWNYGMLSIVYIGYFITSVISISYSSYKLITKKDFINNATKEYLTRHIKYIVFLSFIWSWGFFNFWLLYKFKEKLEFKKQERWVNMTSLIMINISGFIQALLRNWEKAFWIKSKKLCKKRRMTRVSTAMSADFFTTVVFSKEFKEIDDMWNMPTSVIMQESLKSNATLCILSGIHQVFKNLNTDIRHCSITPEHINEVTKHKVYFRDSEYKISIITFYSFPYCVIEEHCPKIFANLRNFENIDTAQVLKSLHPESNKMTLLSLHQEQGGSGSLFIFTEDQRFVMKLITQNERTTLVKKLLLSYYHHIEEYPSSFLNRLLGVYTIKIPGLSPIDVILAPSLVDETVDKFYDLKGSTYNRLSHKPQLGPFKGPYKDSDFLNESAGFFFPAELRDKILVAIKTDAKFLVNNGIMDYSLIVCLLKKNDPGVYNTSMENSYRLGIIDYLGEFNFKRKAEYYVKYFRMGNRIKMCSVMNPRSYYNRFIEFMTEKVFIKDSYRY
jgi:Phosphatidylinositol-4-phosphate 5-Kinase